MDTPEIDLDELDHDLYAAWKELQDGHCESAEILVANSWRTVRQFRASLGMSVLPSTMNRGPKASIVRAIYKVFNRFVACDAACEWVYPYGWVPEEGCPKHG